MWRSLRRYFKAEESIALPPSIGRQLAAIEPSICGTLRYYPCLVTLKNGSKLDRVYFVEKEAYIQQWSVLPQDDPTKDGVAISQVFAIVESPSRLPAQFANRLYAGPESGMGYKIFTVIFSDNFRQAFITGNAIDFIEYPLGHNPDDVIDVIDNAGRETNPMPGPKHYWCLFTGKVPDVGN